MTKKLSFKAYVALNLRYDPLTGLFKWTKQNPKNAFSGEIAGSLDKGYIRIEVMGRRVFGHQLAWYYIHGTWPKKKIDHINGIKSDNRMCNLRLSSESQIQWNQRIRKDNRSGVKGVSWCKITNKWRARVECEKVNVEAGRYSDINSAVQAVQIKRKELHGEFARNY